jgi:hypothetical protein
MDQINLPMDQISLPMDQTRKVQAENSSNQRSVTSRVLALLPRHPACAFLYEA